jgi:DNA modification methylase
LKRRRSLTHVGGAVDTAGNRDVALKLAEALDVKPAPEPGANGGADGDDPDRAHVHGFHTYPARMHPMTAARLVRALTAPNAAVLDPFCGSGTVLVEAMIAGRRPVGVDISPLAVGLSRVKTARLDSRHREALVTRARWISGFANDRRVGRAGATRRYPREDVELFDPHVLLELDSIRAAIADGAGGDLAVADALKLVLSAILLKVSRRASDTSETEKPRRIAAGYPARLFVRKAEDFARRLGELESLLPPGAPAARVDIDDASRLRTVHAATIDGVVTSPPYVATYDYLAHQGMRMRWLELDANALSAGEIGARRRYARLAPGAAREAWTRELGAALRAMSRVCKRGGRVALILGDSAVGDEALRADKIVSSIAQDAGFALLARASQARPHFHGPTVRAFASAPRAEHAIALEKR